MPVSTPSASSQTLTTPATGLDLPSAPRAEERRGIAVLAFAFGLALCIHSVLVWSSPSADPVLGYSRDLSLSIDGPWYLAEARSWVDGSTLQVDPHYRKPFVTWPAALIYKFAGVGLASSRALSYCASLATLLLLTFVLLRRFGPVAAAVGVFVLATHPAWLAFVRSPVIYPAVAFWMLAALAVGSGRSWKAWGGGVLLVGVGALFLKAIVLLVLPALLCEGWIRAGRTRYAHLRWPAAGVLLAVALVVAGPWARPDFWRQIYNYLGGADWSLWQAMRFEERSRFLSAFPLLVPIAFVGALLFPARLGLGGVFPGKLGRRAPERLLHLAVWIPLPLFVVSAYTPLRYLIFAAPILVYLSVGTLVSMSRLGQSRRVAAPPRLDVPLVRSSVVVGGALLALFVLVQLVEAARLSPLPATALGACAAGALLVVTGWLGARLSKRADGSSSEGAPTVSVGLPMAVAVLFAVVALLPALARWAPFLQTPSHTLRDTGREIAAILPEDALLAGPYAHALTLENGLAAAQMSSLRYGGGKLQAQVEDLGCSHLVFDETAGNPLPAIFAGDGVTLEFVARFAVRETSVLLYRVAGSAVEPSPFEQGIGLLKADATAEELALASRRLAAAARRAPESATVWYRIGEHAQRSRDPNKAHSCYQRAVELDPACVDAQFALSQLYALGGYSAEAKTHLAAARAVLPDDPRWSEASTSQ